MLLKETFRYQNFLNTLIDNALAYVNDRNNVTTITQTHKRSQANPNATDEVITVVVDRDYNWSVGDVLGFIGFVINEKSELSDEIARVKSKASNNIDTILSKNKSIQKVLDSLKYGNSRIKESNKISSGKGFLINVNGDQVPYYYDIEEKITLDFDRNEVNTFIKTLKTKADANSLEVEKLNVTLDVDFTPYFNVTDTFEECVNDYITNII